ncbi:DUF3413 domain-containing protein [Alteromonadaceae bacterium M269]|nr:DUF3413 domain-containing protein [Alteromonadaceae bacterium M269]
MILIETPRRQRVNKLVLWGHWFSLVNIVMAILIASIYVFTTPFPSTLFGFVYLLTNWTSHIGFLTFMSFVIFILPLCYLVPNVKLVKATASLVAATGLALLALDALVYNRHGVHLSLYSVNVIRNESENAIATFGWQQWGFLALLFVIWLSFQLTISNALWQRLDRIKNINIGIRTSGFFLACFVISHVSHIWADARLYQPIVQQDDMFPLSYPATAKTLMSRYDLLDLKSYETRKELLLDRNIEAISYPRAPVYCAIEPQSSLVLLMKTDNQDLTALYQSLGLSSKAHHFNTNSELQDSVLSTLYGLPHFYHSALQNKAPILFDLTSSFGIPIYTFQDSTFKNRFYSNYELPLDEFQVKADEGSAKLAIALVNSEQLSTLLTEKLVSNNRVLISDISGNSTSQLYSNLHISKAIETSVQEDLAPTMLSLMGCDSDTTRYSTGQNIFDQKRPWVISTMEQNLVIMNASQRIEIDTKGNYTIHDLSTDAQSNEALDMNLLRQAMKHVSRFMVSS